MNFELNNRQLKILDMVTEQGFVTIESLATYFGISQQTIRRDIILMDQHQFLCRFHGGAGIAQDQKRISYADKQAVAVEAKIKIARKAVTLVEPSMTIFIDVGTSAEAFARALRNSEVSPLRVVTSSIIVANILLDMPGAEVLVPGGSLKTTDGALVGGYVNTILRSFRYDFSFIGGSGFDVNGTLMDFDIEKTQVKHAAIENSNKVVILADSGKYRRNASIKVVSVEKMDYLVSDALPFGSLKEQMQRAFVEVWVG